MMKKAKELLLRVLYPPKFVIFIDVIVSILLLGYVFFSGETESAAAYIAYCISAYALTVLVTALPKAFKRAKASVKGSKAFQRLIGTKFVSRYLNDLSFRGSVSIYQGMTVNFLYVIFRIVTGIRYASVWFISMAAYYFTLGLLRAYLIRCYRDTKADKNRCYRCTAWLLFLLNITMGGMILQMIVSNSGYSYPGHIIYISAMYTFYTMILSVVNIVRSRRLGDPILSAARVLNFISAMMSVLGLQTAMISQFSENDEDFRKLMNTLTGGAVYTIVIITAVYMLIRSRKIKVEAERI